MTLCINPNCQRPENADNQLFCQNCGSEILLAGRYKVTKLLSDKGGFGKTYQVEDSSKNNIVKVLKILTLNVPKAVELFQQEAAVLQRLNHPGIPQGDGYIEFFPKNSQDPLHCFVMQYIEGMDLEEYLNYRGRPIDQKMALKWLKEIAEILQVVHGEKFFHRDIKPSNIMLQPTGKLALIDFGTAREVTGTYMAKQNSGAITKISSAGFTPPEQENNRAVPQSDFFALGRTFVYLLTGKLPTDPTIYDAYNNELKWRQFAKNTSPLLADLIDELMAGKASQRPDNPGVILGKLADIEYQLYPPPKPTQPPKVPKPPNKTVTPTVVSQPYFNRRKLIKIAGFGGVGIMGGFVLREFLFNPHPSPLKKGGLEVLRSSNSSSNNSSKSQSLPKKLILSGTPSRQIDIYSQPTTRSYSPHYGLGGDRVTAFQQSQGDDGYTWYFIEFPSGADGWVRSDFVRSIDSESKVTKKDVKLPRSAQLKGQVFGSRVNIRSAPSSRSNSPHYGLVGDRVTAFQQAQGDDGYTWYFIEFPSGATGWVRDDFIEIQ